MTKAQFGAVLRDPATGPKLSAMLADNARVEAQLQNVKTGPRKCCSHAAYVIFCDGEIDTWKCSVCGYGWTAPCR